MPRQRARATKVARARRRAIVLVDPSANPTRNRRPLAAPACVLGRARDSVTVPSLRPSQERRSPRRIPRRTYGRAHRVRALMRFPIVQLEFTHALGPPAGRYTVREDAPSGNGAAPGAA